MRQRELMLRRMRRKRKRVRKIKREMKTNGAQQKTQI
jgi:hypothetical protein